jgi:HNH endonuclease
MQFQIPPQFLIKSYKRHYHKVKEVAEILAASNGSFSFSYSYKKDEAFQSKVETPDDETTLRFVVLMRRFLNPTSILFYKRVWEVLKELFPEAIPAEHASQLEQLIDVLNKGSFSFIMNQQPVTAENIYQRVADGDYFGRNDEEAVVFLHSLLGTPAEQLALFEFYSYNFALFNVAAILFDIMLGIERSEQYGSLFREEISTDKRCIYCLNDNGTFTSEEHIVPESLGNYDTTLPKGFVCDTCNNEVLSGLDAALVHFEPIEFLKTLYMPHTKDGKLPQAAFPNLTMKKTRPSHIVFKSPSKKYFTTGEPDENGFIHFSIKTTGRKKFDPKIIGRALYKIGLGMVAFHEGRDVACESRYDAARAFILRGEDFPNNLLMNNSGKPHPNIRSTYDLALDGTCFQIDIYSLIFLFNLETLPVLKLTEELTEMNFSSFPLHPGVG